ncbi:MAG: YchJ family protein [Methylococcales bacterium]|nr:YchJ family protein [Methylococcales bacterium]
MIDNSSLCFCGSGDLYDSCCGLMHAAESMPVTAESLMRSRFTAYAMKNESYLLTSWEAGTRPEEIDFSKELAVWTKLDIISTKKGTEKDNKGVVEFKAYYTLDEEEFVMHEISRFKKVAGHWFYLDGKVKSVAKVGSQVSQGKNAPCSCGSGKKFKRCCGK